ncbi:hypothetical protein [Pseudobacteriovorax antillogorgiicola]|uniref:Uncharacterized protein n=1 Tax=Pseudobacteriovorax antillogorgiicola TaxID=1513793 RepID=A0A1Y6CIJ3_9BACT|nr:hypothetical protein [Pseudobacteriovorax antillogorgiicola]TCS46666.1 hypothetical protein EDD56_12342 [Pseudobacteriovorax antillogorgiicola]SMF66564.1 hypothetical protein SAMN06296036_12342 [Pseudobacteriovorax antillogorgiicola]
MKRVLLLAFTTMFPGILKASIAMRVAIDLSHRSNSNGTSADLSYLEIDFTHRGQNWFGDLSIAYPGGAYPKPRYRLNKNYTTPSWTADDRLILGIAEAGVGYQLNSSTAYQISVNPSLGRFVEFSKHSSALTLFERPWSQLAIQRSSRYESWRWQAVLGTGEGTFTPQSDSYFLYQGLSYQLSPSSWFHLEGTINQSPSTAMPIRWLSENRDSDIPGFRKQRIQASLWTDGSGQEARGLRGGIALQWFRTSDANASVDLDLTLPSSLDPIHGFYEQDKSSSSLQRLALSSFASYRILDQFIVASGFEMEVLHARHDIFSFCKTQVDPTCQSDQVTDQLRRHVVTVTFGSDYGESLYFGIDYYNSSYDKLYEIFNFDGVMSFRPENQSFDAFAARLYFKL